jgi:organic radical activating enzyme
MSQKNNVYCPLIYQGMYVERRDSENSLVAPCCAAKGELFTNDQIDFDSNPFLQRLRKENAAGIASAECRECWNSEKYQDTSRRIMSLRMSKLTDSIFDSSNHSFVNLDWNVEPICNGKCIICSSYYSSAWAAEDNRFIGMYEFQRSLPDSKRNNIINSLDLTTLKKVYFNGGEPVLSQDPVNLLTKLDNMDRLSQVEVGFNMNGSTMPSTELIRLLKKAKKVQIFVSIDGIEKKFEYIRNPLKWTDLEKNIKSLIELEFDELFMTTAVGIHNLQIAAETEKWWKTFTNQYQNSTTTINNICQLVQGTLSINNISVALRDQILMDMQGADQKPLYYHLGVNCLKTANGANGDNKWISWLESLDQRRNLCWKETFPALYNSAKAAGVIK